MGIMYRLLEKNLKANPGDRIRGIKAQVVEFLIVEAKKTVPKKPSPNKLDFRHF